MIFIEYPKCSTCKKAKLYLDKLNLNYEDRDIKLNNPTKDELKKWIKMSQKEIHSFFNTSGIKYRELNLKEVLKELDDEEKLKLLASDGMLVKRPVLVLNDKVLVGFKIKEWDNILGKGDNK